MTLGLLNSPGLKSMSELHKLNNHATSSSIIMTIAFGLLLLALVQFYLHEIVLDKIFNQNQSRVRWKNVDEYILFYFSLRWKTKRSRHCGLVLPYNVHKILRERKQLEAWNFWMSSLLKDSAEDILTLTAAPWK